MGGDEIDLTMDELRAADATGSREAGSTSSHTFGGTVVRMAEDHARDDDPVTARLDRLSEACRAAPHDIEPQIALWSAICSLDEWVFIDRGSSEQPRPYALAAEAGSVVCIYSTPERARAGAIANGLISEDEAVPLFTTPLPAALDWMQQLGGAGVTGVSIDYPQLGAWTPLPNLLRFRHA